MTTEHSFHDPLSQRTVVLVIGDDRSTTGVRHKDIEWNVGNTVARGCAGLADVSPELDSAYCSTCQWQARISGAWFMDMIRKAWPPKSAEEVLFEAFAKPTFGDPLRRELADLAVQALRGGGFYLFGHHEVLPCCGHTGAEHVECPMENDWWEDDDDDD